MALDFFLNELSYRVPAKDIRSAKNIMASFVAVLSSLKRAAGRLQDAPQLRTNENFQAAVLAPDYTVSKWRGDDSVDHVQRLLFKTYAAQAPFLHNIPTEATHAFPELYEYKFDGTTCLGFGFAHLLEGIAVSLATDLCWDASSIEVTTQYVTGDSDEAFSVRIPHASTVRHVKEIEPFLTARLADENSQPKNLKEMWEKRKHLFPHLAFCGGVGDQLESLEPVQHLNGVLSSLRGYNEYSRTWSEQCGEFNPRAMLHFTPESPGRLERYREQLTFEWVRRNHVFSFHGRFTPGAGRIHMWPDLANRRIVIGYIGMKIGI